MKSDEKNCSRLPGLHDLTALCLSLTPLTDSGLRGHQVHTCLLMFNISQQETF